VKRVWQPRPPDQAERFGVMLTAVLHDGEPPTA
jgi:hypothetical protein